MSIPLNRSGLKASKDIYNIANGSKNQVEYVITHHSSLIAISLRLFWMNPQINAKLNHIFENLIKFGGSQGLFDLYR